jgi:hypothetical protein
MGLEGVTIGQRGLEFFGSTLVQARAAQQWQRFTPHLVGTTVVETFVGRINIDDRIIGVRRSRNNDSFGAVCKDLLQNVAA